MRRKTDSGNSADWLFFAEEDIRAVSVLASQLTGHHICRSKLAEAVEKILKADLLSEGRPLVKTHDLQHLIDELADRDRETARAAQGLAEALAEAYLVDR